MTTPVPPVVDRWISEEFDRLAELVRDYNPNLEFRWIPEHMRTSVHDKANPYCIFDTRINSIVMYASHTDTPVSILEKLINSDNKHGDVLQRMLAHNQAIDLMRMKEQIDQMSEAREFSEFALGNEKNYWKHNGKKYDSEFREII
jgi:hypothetical protein